jgi:hypothetical protein
MAQIQQQDSTYILKVQQQGTKMCQLLIAKDYKSFIKYSYPPVIEMLGGEEKMIEKMTQLLEQMAIGGYIILNGSIEKPLKIVHLKDELQCALAQNMEMKVPAGREMIHSSLIGISTDKGENWTFIDTQNKDLKAMQALFPNLSDSLVMPEKREPELL